MGTCTSTPKTSSSSLSGSLRRSPRSPKIRMSDEEHQLKMSTYHAKDLEVSDGIHRSRPDPIALPVLGITGYSAAKPSAIVVG